MWVVLKSNPALSTAEIKRTGEIKIKERKKKKKTVETDKKINLLLNIFNAMDSFFKNSIFHPLHQTVLTFAILEV